MDPQALGSANGRDSWLGRPINWVWFRALYLGRVSTSNSNDCGLMGGLGNPVRIDENVVCVHVSVCVCVCVCVCVFM